MTDNKFIVLDAKAAGVLAELLEFIIDDSYKTPKLTPHSARLSANYLRMELDDTKQGEHRMKLQGAQSLLDALRASPVGVDALTPDTYRGADHD
jgi:hypothetical protein